MNVTVFGATGNIGRHVVDQLLSADHQVTAYARSPRKLPGPHANLTVHTGELADAAAVREAVHCSHAVISALGPLLKPFGHGAPLTEGTRNIVTAMQAEDVTRFVGLATPSIPDPGDKPHWKHYSDGSRPEPLHHAADPHRQGFVHSTAKPVAGLTRHSPENRGDTT